MTRSWWYFFIDFSLCILGLIASLLLNSVNFGYWLSVLIYCSAGFKKNDHILQVNLYQHSLISADRFSVWVYQNRQDFHLNYILFQLWFYLLRNVWKLDWSRHISCKTWPNVINIWTLSNKDIIATWSDNFLISADSSQFTNKHLLPYNRILLFLILKGTIRNVILLWIP